MLLLLVEDDHLVRLPMEFALEDAGFQLRVASSGLAAMNHLGAEGFRPSALITDIRLGPGPDGFAVANRARELHPHLPIVYITGDSEARHYAEGVPDSIVIPKPFPTSRLVETVEKLVRGTA